MARSFRIVCTLAGLLCLAYGPPLKGDDAPDKKPEARKATPGKFLRLQRDAKGQPIALETAVVRYKPASGEGDLVVDLIGVVHIGVDLQKRVVGSHGALRQEPKARSIYTRALDKRVGLEHASHGLAARDVWRLGGAARISARRRTQVDRVDRRRDHLDQRLPGSAHRFIDVLHHRQGPDLLDYRGFHFGGMRRAPSRRIISPLSMPFSAM